MSGINHSTFRLWLPSLTAFFLTTTGASAIDLKGAYQAALEGDATYQSVRAGSAATREMLPQARAQLLPQLNASGTKFKNDTRSARRITQSDGSTTTLREENSNYGSSNYSLSFRQPIFRVASFAAWRQAIALYDSADAAEDKGRYDMLLRVTSTYFDALSAQDNLAQALTQKEAVANQLEAAHRFIKAGQGTLTDTAEAQARYDMAVAQEIEAREAVLFANEQLQSMVNLPITQISPLNPERMQLTPPEPAQLEPWVERGEIASPELRRLTAEEEVARKELLKAQSGHLPTLDLVAQRNRTENDSVVSQNTIYHNTQYGLQLSIPLFSSGYNSGVVGEARQNLIKAQHDREAARRALRLQVRKVFQAISDGLEKVRALEQSLLSAEQALFATKKGVQAGTRTTIDVLNAIDKRALAARDLGVARYRYLYSRIGLEATVGGDAEAELERINRWLDNSLSQSPIAK